MRSLIGRKMPHKDASSHKADLLFVANNLDRYEERVPFGTCLYVSFMFFWGIIKMLGPYERSIHPNQQDKNRIDY